MSKSDLVIRMGDVYQGESCRWYVAKFTSPVNAPPVVTLESMEGRITQRPVSIAILFANYILIEPNNQGVIVWRDSQEVASAK